MKYEIRTKASAEKEIRDLPNPVLRRVHAKIESLADNPRPAGCVKLAQMEGYRVRVGNYRIVYTINDATRYIDIIAVDHRRQVYRRRR